MRNSLSTKIVFIFLAFGFIFSSCEINNKVNSNDDLEGEIGSTESPIENGYSRVIVTTEYAKEGCSYLLVAQAMGDVELLQPLTLDDKYKEHGKVLYIKFRPSRAPQTGDCKMGSLISIDEVVIVQPEK